MISALTFLIFGVGMLIVGIISCPLILFLRARKDGSWDDSNMTNIFRLVAHIATHPSDFPKMQYPDGKKPFWYLTKDEITDIVNSRPND